MATFEKTADYGTLDNYVIEGELTVTITLAEYRKLVEENAKNTSVQEKLRGEKYNLAAELREAKAALEYLKQPSDNGENAEEEAVEARKDFPF